MSTPSKAEATRAQARSTSETLETSAAIASRLHTVRRRDLACLALRPRAFAGHDRHVHAFRCERARATARPMPTLPPVMTARLP